MALVLVSPYKLIIPLVIWTSNKSSQLIALYLGFVMWPILLQCSDKVFLLSQTCFKAWDFLWLSQFLDFLSFLFFLFFFFFILVSHSIPMPLRGYLVHKNREWKWIFCFHSYFLVNGNKFGNSISSVWTNDWNDYLFSF